MSKKIEKVTGKPKALKHWLADEIESKILSGEYRAGKLLDSERVLCEKHQVSRITVRATLDILEKSGLIRRYPRRGVLVIGKNATGKKQVSPKKHSNQILFVSNPINLTSRLVADARRFCQENDLEFLCLNAGVENENFQGYIENPPESVDGVILTPFMMPEYIDAIQGLVESGIPVVCVDRVLEGLDVSSVMADNFTGSYQATSHLIQQWDRPVYHIGYRQCPSSAGQRFEGWRAAMEDHGFYRFEDKYLFKLMHPEEENWAPPRRKYEEYGYEMAKKIFSRTSQSHPAGWSILAVNDTTAMGVYRAAEKMGLHIGEDVAVVGFDDLPLAKRCTPTLSTVRLEESLGYNGAKLLYQEMKNPKDRAIHQVLPVKLIIRESSVPVGKTVADKKNQEKLTSRVRSTL